MEAGARPPHEFRRGPSAAAVAAVCDRARATPPGRPGRPTMPV